MPLAACLINLSDWMVRVSGADLDHFFSAPFLIAFQIATNPFNGVETAINAPELLLAATYELSVPAQYLAGLAGAFVRRWRS